MVYVSSSMKEIMAMVIRLTRVKDTSYIADMDEWIYEAMQLMRTKVILSNQWKDVEINFHKGQLPIGTRSIAAVEWRGHRVARGNSVRNPTAPRQASGLEQFKGTTNGFEFVPQYYYPNNDAANHGKVQTFDLVSVSKEECNALPCLEGVWYTTELNYITFSVPSAMIRVHYRAMACDTDGLPLIPDNGDYKQAIYFYCRAAMIGAGWEDPVLNYDKIMGPGGYFELHAARAMSSIKYPSVDSMEFKVNEHQRLIKDNFYFDNFFSSPNPERIYGYDDYLYNLNPGTPKTYINGNPDQVALNAPPNQP